MKTFLEFVTEQEKISAQLSDRRTNLLSDAEINWYMRTASELAEVGGDVDGKLKELSSLISTKLVNRRKSENNPDLSLSDFPDDVEIFRNLSKMIDLLDQEVVESIYNELCLEYDKTIVDQLQLLV